MSINLKINIFILIGIVLYSGCAVQLKTDYVPDNTKFEEFTFTSTKKDDVLIRLGSPQSTGIHKVDNENYELDYYFGLSGVAGISTGEFETGNAFLTYKGDDLKQLLYFNTWGQQKSHQEKDIPITKIAKEIEIGISHISKIYEILGTPNETGRRLQFDKGIDHKVAFYDVSDITDDGAIKEKWFLVGYDNHDIIQDIIWVSSYPEDIKRFGDITPQELMQISRMDQADWGIVYARPEAFSTNTKIDPVQVEALLRTLPKSIDDITSVLGKPTAYGIKSFKSDDSVFLAHYSHMSIELTGREEKYISPSADEKTRKANLTNEKHHVIDAKQTFLIIGHDVNGNIKEIIWVKPST